VINLFWVLGAAFVGGSETCYFCLIAGCLVSVLVKAYDTAIEPKWFVYKLKGLSTFQRTAFNIH